MATLKNNSAFLFRGIKTSLNFEVGVTRAQGLAGESPTDSAQADLRKLEQERTESVESANGDQDYGRDLHAGDRHYRAYVGPPKDYDLIASIQATLLLAAGLREDHRLVDVGCGSLRAGRMLIPYLRPGHYFGVEPNRWLVEEGIKRELGDDIVRLKEPTFRFVDDFSLGAFGFDFPFALAQSVFSHTYPDLALLGLRGIADALAPKGKLFATFVEGESSTEEGSGWRYPQNISYTWEEMLGFVEESGLVARRINWMHPRQSWFVAAHPDAEGEIDDLSRRLRPPLQHAGTGTSAANGPDPG